MKRRENERKRERGSATQKWMKRNLTNVEGKIIPKPKAQNQLPRKKGVLAKSPSKTRTLPKARAAI